MIDLESMVILFARFVVVSVAWDIWSYFFQKFGGKFRLDSHEDLMWHNVSKMLRYRFGKTEKVYRELEGPIL